MERDFPSYRASSMTSSSLLFQTTITNLTLELNQTELLDPARLREVVAVLVSLQAMADQNQRQVDLLTGQVCA